MPDLDDTKAITSLDPSGLGGRLRSLPGQCEAAWRQARGVKLPAPDTPLSHIVVAGMGGSAIAGDLLADLASAGTAVPITVVRGFRLPFAVDERTLVAVCSFSGNTQETLSLYRQAVATKAAVVVVTGGGMLAQQAKENRTPILRVEAGGEPRSALGYHLMLLLSLLDRLGIIETTGHDVRTAVASLGERVSQLESSNPTKNNPAKQLALELEGSTPLIFGGGLFSGLARRWKTQLNENAKVWAFCETVPEVLHNTVESFGARQPMGPPLRALLLQPATGADQLAAHYRVASKLLEENSIPQRILKGSGGAPLAQLLDMLALGDFVSYHLAMLRGVDPSPTPGIDRAKELLSGC